MFVKFISATPKTMSADPIICISPACSLKMIMPKINDSTADRTFVIVTIDMSAVFKTLKTINQLRARSRPFRAKIKTNFKGIFIPIGNHIKLRKNETLVNKTRIVDSFVFFTASFLNIL